MCSSTKLSWLHQSRCGRSSQNHRAPTHESNGSSCLQFYWRITWYDEKAVRSVVSLIRTRSVRRCGWFERLLLPFELTVVDGHWEQLTSFLSQSYWSEEVNRFAPSYLVNSDGSWWLADDHPHEHYPSSSKSMYTTWMWVYMSVNLRWGSDRSHPFSCFVYSFVCVSPFCTDILRSFG